MKLKINRERAGRILEPNVKTIEIQDNDGGHLGTIAFDSFSNTIRIAACKQLRLKVWNGSWKTVIEGEDLS